MDDCKAQKLCQSLSLGEEGEEEEDNEDDDDDDKKLQTERKTKSDSKKVAKNQISKHRMHFLKVFIRRIRYYMIFLANISCCRSSSNGLEPDAQCALNRSMKKDSNEKEKNSFLPQKLFDVDFFLILSFNTHRQIWIFMPKKSNFSEPFLFFTVPPLKSIIIFRECDFSKEKITNVFI